MITTQANGGISRDGKTIVWHLRSGVRWSDGAPFDADDVVFTVKAILNPANDEEQGTAGWDRIARMDEPDKHTVVFHLKAPYGSYLPLFFGTAADEPCILPKHILGSLPTINDAPFNRKPVGIGPFRVVAWKHGDAIELEANPYYWRGKPKLTRITYKLLPSQETLMQQIQTGEVDLWPLMPPSYTARLQQVPNVHVLLEPNYRTTNLDFVVAHRPLVADVRVRQAVRYVTADNLSDGVAQAIERFCFAAEKKTALILVPLVARAKASSDAGCALSCGGSATTEVGIGSANPATGASRRAAQTAKIRRMGDSVTSSAC